MHGHAEHVWCAMTGDISPKEHARTDIEGVRMGVAVSISSRISGRRRPRGRRGAVSVVGVCEGGVV